MISEHAIRGDVLWMYITFWKWNVVNRNKILSVKFNMTIGKCSILCWVKVWNSGLIKVRYCWQKFSWVDWCGKGFQQRDLRVLCFCLHPWLRKVIKIRKSKKALLIGWFWSLNGLLLVWKKVKITTSQNFGNLHSIRTCNSMIWDSGQV